MLRFPNPGSTISNFIAVYTAAFKSLNGYVINLDDIVWAVVEANLATSSGYMGEQAVARSTRQDRSRDPLYNQMKMYTELFRILGWLHPTEHSSLNFVFTLLGHQVVISEGNYLLVFSEGILGISFPNRLLNVKGSYDLRPFAFLLKVMLAADGYISRDEMIVGPLSASSDRAADSVARVAAQLRRTRVSRAAGAAHLAEVARDRGTQVNTLRNYTRWPIAVLRDCGWAVKDRATDGDGHAFEVFRLTASGRAAAEWLLRAHDIRLDDVERLPADERAAFSIDAHYRMLGRAGFDLTPVLPALAAHGEAALAARRRLAMPPTGDVLFSPMQALAIGELAAIFPAAPPPQFRQVREGTDPRPTGRGSRDHLFVAPVLIPAARADVVGTAPALHAELAALADQHGSLDLAAAEFSERHAQDTKAAFYPLVSHLFQVLGYRSEFSRAGVHYQRWDACVWVDDAAIPIEIKSPTEEMFLSTKAVRQALENKVVLLSRGGLQTRPDLTSLIVGFRLPNERGDMARLIDDIYQTYGLAIGVVDLQTLVGLAIRSVVEGVTIEPEQLRSLRGFLHG